MRGREDQNANQLAFDLARILDLLGPSSPLRGAASNPSVSAVSSVVESFLGAFGVLSGTELE